MLTVTLNEFILFGTFADSSYGSALKYLFMYRYIFFRGYWKIMLLSGSCKRKKKSSSTSALILIRKLSVIWSNKSNYLSLAKKKLDLLFLGRLSYWGIFKVNLLCRYYRYL